MIEQWHDFFIMVGGGAAALTGLVFVAMSLNLEAILKEETHRHRAIGTLTGFTAVFVICALTLMGNQNYQAVGMEWLIASSVAAYIYIQGAIHARTNGRSSLGLGLSRLILGTSLYLIEIVGTIMIILGYIVGLYVAAIAMIFLLAYTITGAWLLLVGVYVEEKKLLNKK
ncbi:MAG TPA: hypothetical protein VG935_03135 [Patescibacteria group bacterium]|nr:hypothetical protein [Patescibacteria group bacterium]